MRQNEKSRIRSKKKTQTTKEKTLLKVKPIPKGKQMPKERTKPESEEKKKPENEREPEEGMKQTSEDQLKSNENFPIVGIGASAGGLSAFESFFSGILPEVNPGVAFI